MNVLYYPFHLCHEQTLERLLEDYQTVHFRDFMALQLTPFMGTTAFPDRMGDYHPELLKAGRIVQGYDLNGPLPSELISAVNRDLADPSWRWLFQEALTKDSRFQRGLFPDPKDSSVRIGQAAEALPWVHDQHLRWTDHPFQVDTVQALSRQRLQGEAAIRFEYGWALIKTSASLVYTIELCHGKNLVAATDSKFHYQLLERTCERDQIALRNSWANQKGSEGLSIPNMKQ